MNDKYYLDAAIFLCGVVVGGFGVSKLLARSMYKQLTHWIDFLSNDIACSQWYQLDANLKDREYKKGKIDAYTNFRDSLTIMM